MTIHVKKSKYLVNVYNEIQSTLTNKAVTVNKHSLVILNGRTFPLIDQALYPKSIRKSSDFSVDCGKHPIFGRITKKLNDFVKEDLPIDIISQGLYATWLSYNKPPVFEYNSEPFTLDNKYIRLIKDGPVHQIQFNPNATGWKQYYFIEFDVNILGGSIKKSERQFICDLIDKNPIVEILDSIPV